MKRLHLGLVGLGALAVGLLPGALVEHGHETRPRSEGVLARLLGPIGPLAANVQWVRFQAARLDGDDARAIVLAESALALDPVSPTGWILFSSHLALLLGSPLHEADPERRLAWVHAGLRVLRHGEAHCETPGELALQAGVILLTHLEIDPELPWPDGPQGLLDAATAAFERAAELGHAMGAEMAAACRERRP